MSTASATMTEEARPNMMLRSVWQVSCRQLAPRFCLVTGSLLPAALSTRGKIPMTEPTNPHPPEAGGGPLL